MEEINKLHNELRDSQSDSDSKNICKKIAQLSKRRGISLVYATFLVVNKINNI